MKEKQIKTTTETGDYSSYDVEVAATSSQLAFQVEKALSKGWKLQGGVAILFEKDKFLYAQAMVL